MSPGEVLSEDELLVAAYELKVQLAAATADPTRGRR
jgi:hypothetical protein